MSKAKTRIRLVNTTLGVCFLRTSVCFQKITFCDFQVGHYYCRLVRRMNKLLGPELSLDAKNPKDTNAAMLRWYISFLCYALWAGIVVC